MNNNGKTKKTEQKNEGNEREKARRIEVLTVIGQIEGHYALPEGSKSTGYDEILPYLASVENDPETAGLLILLNTVGGDVEAGLAIAEMIAGMRKKTVSLVLGGGHSIGIPIAVAADVSFIVPTGTMTLHPVRYTGLVMSAPQSFNYLAGMQERILAFLGTHSHADPEAVRALMLKNEDMANDLGTILVGEEAVRLGLIDRVGGLGDALEELRR